MAMISIIVPVYSVEIFLPRCIESILAQSFQDFELILVDDGSPDRSGRICDNYSETDNRIHVIHQQNGGLSAARNAGIDWVFQNSDSEWIAFIDSDDWVHPKYLEYLYTAVKTNNVLISVCNYLETDARIPDEEPIYKAEQYDWATLLMQNNVRAVVAWNKLYAKQLFTDLRYPIGKIHEDEFVTYKLLHYAGSIIYLPTVLYYYFQNTKSITGGIFFLRRLDCADALLERICFVRGLKNDELLGYCVRQFLSYCWRMLPILRSAEWIEADLRAEKEKEIRRKFQIVLASFGLQYVPPGIKGEYYDYAFPLFYKLARKSIRVIRKAGRSKK